MLLWPGRAVMVSAAGDARQWLEQYQSTGASRLLLWGRAHGVQASHEPSSKQTQEAPTPTSCREICGLFSALRCQPVTMSSAMHVVVPKVPDSLWARWARECRCLTLSGKSEKEASVGNGCSLLKCMESCISPPRRDELVPRAGLWSQ